MISQSQYRLVVGELVVSVTACQAPEAIREPGGNAVQPVCRRSPQRHAFHLELDVVIEICRIEEGCQRSGPSVMCCDEMQNQIPVPAVRLYSSAKLAAVRDHVDADEFVSLSGRILSQSAGHAPACPVLVRNV